MNIRSIAAVSCTLLATLLGRAGELNWLTDYDAAVAKAAREDKAVLVDFTGSDWCGWCMKLKSEVFDKPEFAEFARTRLVLVEGDFPHQKGMAQAQKQANERLPQAYHIPGFPTIVVLNQNGQQVGRTGYVAG